MEVELFVNGENKNASVPPETTLLKLLNLISSHFTPTKKHNNMYLANKFYHI